MPFPLSVYKVVQAAGGDLFLTAANSYEHHVPMISICLVQDRAVSDSRCEQMVGSRIVCRVQDRERFRLGGYVRIRLRASASHSAMITLARNLEACDNQTTEGTSGYTSLPRSAPFVASYAHHLSFKTCCPRITRAVLATVKAGDDSTKLAKMKFV